ncbi:MAG TPA: hypothetical protein VF384_17065 [Planctomycetota bacterium]
MRGPRCASWFAASVCALAPAVAQAAPRTGRVVDARGTGVLATVHVRSVSPCGLPVDEQPPVPTAADGSFVLPAALGEHYAAFASTADAASLLVERRGLEPLELRLQTGEAKPLQVDGLAAWRDEGPLRAFALLPAPFSWGMPVVLDGRGKGQLPVLPPGDVMLELRTAADGVVWRERLLRGMPRLTVAVPEPVAVRLRAVDASGAPVAGAVVHHEQEQGSDTRAAPFAVAPEWRHRVLGRTDAKGCLSVRVPHAAEDGVASAFAGVLRVVHEAHAAARVAWHGDTLDGGQDGDGGVLEVRLDDGSPFDVTLRLDGKPFAQRRVLLFARVGDVEMAADGFRYSVRGWQGAATTDAAGKAIWPDFPNGAGELRLVPVANASERLPACLVLHGRAGQEIDVGPARRVVVHVRDAAGTALPGVPVVAMPSPPDLMLLEPYGCEPRTVTDAGGRAELVLPPARFWIAASNGEGFAHALANGAEGDRGEPLAVAMAWRPFAVWDARVEYRGEPVPGAHFVLGGTQWIDGAPIPPEAELLPLQWLGQFNWLLVRAGSADAAGRLRVRHAPTGVSATQGSVRGPGRRAPVSGELTLLPEKLPPRLELK